MTEKQPYSVLERYPELELREYPAGMQIETEVRGDFINAGSIGFRPLVNFISGNNKAGQAIAMTAPVIQESVTNDRHKVRFVMPKEMDQSSTPSPADSRVVTIEVPAHLAAARKFGGSWNKEKFEKEGARLLEEVSKAGLVPVGNLYWSRFDPPWKPGFLKHNEVLIRVKKAGTKNGN
jgi:SOUL heme-binding protein